MWRSIPITTFVIVLFSIILSNCATSISKTAFRDYYHHKDFYANMKATPEKLHWGTCFDITEEELEIEINRIHLECIDREMQEMPSTINSDQEKMFRTSVELCSVLKYMTKYKDKFTFDKSPQYLDHCKKLYKELIQFK